MAKQPADTDTAMQPLNGKWIWKDDTHTLEYVSNNPVDRHDRRRDRRQQKGAVHTDIRGRQSPNQQARGAFNVVKEKMGIRGTVGQRVISGRTHYHTNVKIEDIKVVACDMTGEENLSDTFNGLFETVQFDEFLICLINYFHWFFEKLAQDEKPNPMNIEPSLREKQYYADLLKKIDIAQKVLGQSYCILVLGEGIATQHHMECGRSRVSNTYKDRSMYETLYIFCSYVVWIAFRRNKDYEAVKKELNRILRSETFNPAIRIKNAPDDDEGTSADSGETSAAKQEQPQLTPAEYRRKQGNRPPIKSIINQRSPALVSILPTPKEDASWLFKSQGKDAMNALAQTNREDIAKEDMARYAHLNIDRSSLKMGIIGEPLSNFNPITLTPKGVGVEEGEEEETGSEERRGSVSGKQAASGERKMSREGTGISQVTQDGLPDEE